MGDIVLEEDQLMWDESGNLLQEGNLILLRHDSSIKKCNKITIL